MCLLVSYLKCFKQGRLLSCSKFWINKIRYKKETTFYINIFHFIYFLVILSFLFATGKCSPIQNIGILVWKECIFFKFLN